MTASADSAGGMFRAEALEARRRIEALPRTIHVAGSWTRAAVVGLTLLAGAMTLASVYIIIPVQVSGSGAIIDRSGRLLASVTTTSPGFVEAVLVSPGEQISRGHPIARLSLPEQVSTVAKLRAIADGLQRESTALDALADQSRQSEVSVRDARSASLDLHIANLERRIAGLQDREAAEKRLLQKGVSTETRLIAAQVAVQDAIVDRDQARSEKANLQSATVEGDARRAEERLERRLRLDQARLEVEAAERDLAARNVLTSPVDGVVGDILLQPGAPATAGQIIALVTAQTGGTDQALEGAIFVPLAEGKHISPGDPVLLWPASLPDSENDRMRAVVKSVSSSAAPESAILATLGNDQLTELAVRSGPVFEVIVELQRDKRTPSGFVWTSGVGPNLTLTRGTPLAAKIEVEHVPLISLALPALRRLFQKQESPWTGDKL